MPVPSDVALLFCSCILRCPEILIETWDAIVIGCNVFALNLQKSVKKVLSSSFKPVEHSNGTFGLFYGAWNPPLKNDRALIVFFSLGDFEHRLFSIGSVTVLGLFSSLSLTGQKPGFRSGAARDEKQNRKGILMLISAPD